MSIIVNGFNRFNQLYYLQLVHIYSGAFDKKSVSYNENKLNSELHSKNSICDFSVIGTDFGTRNYQFLFSWSYCLVYNSDSFWLCGFIDGKNNSLKSFKAPNENKIIQASCNRKQLICVTEDLCCWQYNIETGLWKELTSILNIEVTDEKISRVTAAKVCCGELVTGVLTSTGGVFNLPNKLNLQGVKIVDITCGRAHILLLSANGEVFSVGEGSRGQLGHGELEAEDDPRLVEGLAGLTVVKIACGGWHSCAVTADGDLYTWGWNMCGQLGLKTAKAGSGVAVQALPAVVDWPEQEDVRVHSVVCGARHTVTLMEDGSVWGCGWNGYGQLSLPGVDSVDEMTRLPVPQGHQVQRLVCGPWNTCLIT